MKAGIQNVLEFHQQNLTLGINSAFVRWLTLVREWKKISWTAIVNVGYSALTKTLGQRTQRWTVTSALASVVICDVIKINAPVYEYGRLKK